MVHSVWPAERSLRPTTTAAAKHEQRERVRLVREEAEEVPAQKRSEQQQLTWQGRPPGIDAVACGHTLGQTDDMTAREDTALIAAQLAELTRIVHRIASQQTALDERADREHVRADRRQERTQVRQERIDLAARELADVKERLLAAPNALREPV